MFDRRLLIALLLVQLMGWWYLDRQLPFLGATWAPTVVPSKSRHLMLASFDFTPVHKEVYLRFDLQRRTWRSLNRRQAFVDFGADENVDAYWQLISPRGPDANYHAELFDRHTLTVLKRHRLPISDDRSDIVFGPELMANRFVVVVTGMAIECIDLQSDIDPPPLLYSRVRVHAPDAAIANVKFGAANSLIVLVSDNTLHGFAKAVELYHLGDDAGLKWIDQWETSGYSDSVVTWQDKIATLEPKSGQLEVRSLVTGQVLWKTMLPGNMLAVPWPIHEDELSGPLLPIGALGCGHYAIETGEYIIPPAKAMFLADSLPGRKLLLYFMSDQSLCVYDPDTKQTLMTLPSHKWLQVRLRDEDSTYTVDRVAGLSFYRFDNRTGRLVEIYRPFAAALWGLGILTAAYLLWALHWLHPLAMVATMLARWRFPSQGRHSFGWDLGLVLAVPLAMCSYRLATCGIISFDRPAYVLALALHVALVTWICTWSILGTRLNRSQKWQLAGLSLVAMLTWAAFWRDLPWFADVVQPFYMPATCMLVFLQLLRMLGVRLVTPSQRAPIRATLRDYFLLTLWVALFVAALSHPENNLRLLNTMGQITCAIIGHQLLLLSVLATYRVWVNALHIKQM